MTAPSNSSDARSYGAVEPLFICLGVPKAATTWIHRQLEAHPEVGCTFAKEINYWSGNFDKGPEWYASQFPHDQAYRTYAEVSVGYLRQAPLARIAQAVPNARFMVSLRNPYERAWSSYWQSIRTGAYEGSFEDAIRDLPKIINDSLYADGIGLYLRDLPREALHVALYDELSVDPLRFAQQIYDFMGVDPAFVPEHLRERVNVGRRYSATDALLARSQRIVKRLGVRRKHLLALGVWDALEDIYGRLGRQKPIPPLDDSALAALDKHFRTEVQRLEELLDRDLSHWLPQE